MICKSLKVLSPLHIGNGRELTPLDLYPGDGTLYVLDTDKLTRDLLNLGIRLEEILHLLRSPPGNRYVWKDYLDDLGLDVKNYTRYTLPVYGGIGRTSMTVKEFIKTHGTPYIPGSSVKGSLRTAILYKVLRECGDSETAVEVISRVNTKTKILERIGRMQDLIDFYIVNLMDEVKEAKERRGRRFNNKAADDLLEAIVFGMEDGGYSGIRYEPKRDPMRALIVRDSEQIGRNNLAVYRVEVVGNPQTIPIWVEALKPGTVTETEIKVAPKTLRLNMGEFNGLLWECLLNRGAPWEVFEEFLWEAVEEFYGAVRRAEIEESKKFGRYSEHVRAFYSSLDEWEGHTLRLGWGSGWLSMTIGLLLKKNVRWETLRRSLRLGKNPRRFHLTREFPKTRRLAEGMPLGWVVVQ